MKKIIALLITISLFDGYCVAQFYIEPVIGYQIDLNNKNRFEQINSAVQCSFKKSKNYEFVLQLQKSWPLPFFSNDSSFSQNPALPVYANAKKTIRPASSLFAIGHRITVTGKNSSNIFLVVLYTGITSQKIQVSYQYDKSNYTILNPDQTQERVGIIFSGGLEYMRLLKNGRLFIQLNFVTEPVGKKIKYPSSFDFIAPLSLNAGYSIPIKKNKHEK
jgi:hypothetical protein